MNLFTYKKVHALMQEKKEIATEENCYICVQAMLKLAKKKRTKRGPTCYTT
jgi:hypothetical protein